MQHLQPNTTLKGGKYRIERVLGQGGFGITYLATLVSSNRQVAIKELFIGGSGQAINDRRGNQVVVTNSANQQSFNQQKAKFKKEALRLENLNHLNLVKVHEFFEENGTAYYVMDYIEGESLRTKLNREGVLSESLVLKYLQQLLPALEAAHKQSIWHLDIKPENIMVDRYGHVYLIDFGASKHIEHNSTLTTSLALAYTRGYCPPELADLTYGSQNDLVQALKEIGPWTDIYALGATMYNLLTDSIPPSSNRLYKDGRNAFSFPNNVSFSTQDLIVWMMKPNKEDRPQSIKEIDKRQIKLQSNYDESTIINGYVPNSINSDIIYNLQSIAKNMDNYDGGPYYFNEGFAAVQKQGKYGFIDRNGIEAISCIYEDYGDFHEGLANVKLHGKWGYIDKKNNTVVPFIYESTSDCHEGLSDFREGLALVKKNNRYGYIDNTGRVVIPCIYESASPFSEGLARVVTNGKTGYIDISGNMIIPQLYDRGFSFHNGIAVVRNTHKKFFIEIDREGGIDKYGNEVIPIVYDRVSNFGADNLAVVCKSDKSGIIDKNGKLLIPCIYKDAQIPDGLIPDGLIPVKQNNKWGFINASGNVVIPFKFFFANGFSDEMCRVEDKNYLYGYVNKYGSEIIPCKYHDAAQFFHDGFASVKMDNQWGIVNNKGRLIVPCIYDWCGAFQDGLAFVKKNGLSGCVDKEGRSSFDYKKY